MSNQKWDVPEFLERFRDGEFDAHLDEILQSLSPDQLEELQSLLLVEGESRYEYCPKA
jgi:hypothetical protein